MRVTINGCELNVSAGKTIASLIPDARLAAFEKSRHSPQIEERQLFLSTVRDFLDSAAPVA